MWLAWCEAVIKGRPGAITGIALSQEAHLSCARADELHTRTHAHTHSPWDIPTVLHFTFQSSDSMSAFIWSYSRITKIQMTPLVWKACLFLCDAVHHFEKKKKKVWLFYRWLNPTGRSISGSITTSLLIPLLTNKKKKKCKDYILCHLWYFVAFHEVIHTDIIGRLMEKLVRVQRS